MMSSMFLLMLLVQGWIYRLKLHRLLRPLLYTLILLSFMLLSTVTLVYIQVTNEMEMEKCRMVAKVLYFETMKCS
ncbi:uncharacterized protein M6B38_342685 [Iris pallida]|uniref:Uncharacterized protein n=1 Tax=Iris pallida TaxID=29817 RepID=A0AAX6GXE7_IRIPA|nr:uncharacterized protein M6B38_342685 [Iris pallida]